MDFVFDPLATYYRYHIDYQPYVLFFLRRILEARKRFSNNKTK